MVSICEKGKGIHLKKIIRNCCLMGRWNCGNRPPGDSDHQVSDVFAIGTWQEKREMQSGANTWRY